jgi:hypothetical protein
MVLKIQSLEQMFRSLVSGTSNSPMMKVIVAAPTGKQRPGAAESAKPAIADATGRREPRIADAGPKKLDRLRRDESRDHRRQ